MQVFAALTGAARGASAVAAFVRRHGRPIVALVADFVRRHSRLTVLLVVVALLAVPLLRGGDAGAFGLNALGIGMGAMALRRLLRWRLRRTSRPLTGVARECSGSLHSLA